MTMLYYSVVSISYSSYEKSFSRFLILVLFTHVKHGYTCTSLTWLLAVDDKSSNFIPADVTDLIVVSQPSPKQDGENINIF